VARRDATPRIARIGSIASAFPLVNGGIKIAETRRAEAEKAAIVSYPNAIRSEVI
jgi:hypothetical protein